MAKVVLVDRKTSEVLKEVQTERVEWTIDQLMRNRDPRLFVAKEVIVRNKP